jgi:hypothetical protein
MKVSPQTFDPVSAALLTAGLFDGFPPAEFARGGISRFVGIHSRVNVRLRPHLNMRTHLLIHLSVKLALPE